VSRKGNVCADEGPKVKKKRKVLYLLEKVEVLYVKLDKGMRITVVRCHYGGRKLTACVIKKK
jgi:hypothetical protein